MGDSPTFTCSAYGTAPISIDWYRVNPGSGAVAVESGVTESEVGSTEVTTTSVLTLTDGVTIADDGVMFYCVVQNNLTEAGVFSNQSDSATLTVQCMYIKLLITHTN